MPARSDGTERDNGGMTASSAPDRSATRYRERLAPNVWLFILLLLLVPAAMLTVAPIAASIAIPTAIAVYVIAAGSLFLLAPVITVTDDELVAGRSRIPVSQLGQIEVLDREGLRVAIGPGMDARSHLVIRGYIHSGVKIEITDPGDPTPFWIVASRRPTALRDAIEAAR